MKKLLLLFLFIPLVSFGQEDVELNLSVKDSTKNYFGIGFKYETSNKLTDLFDNVIIVDLNYFINNFSVGVEYGTTFEKDIYIPDVSTGNLQKFGLRFGYRTLNDKFIFTSTNGIANSTFELMPQFYDYTNPRPSTTKFYTKFSIILNLKTNLAPELGVFHDLSEGIGFSFGFVYFFKPKP